VGGPSLPRRCRPASGDLSPEGRGVQIIKTVAKDPWGERTRTHTTWYEPFTDQASIDKAVAFVLSQPVTTLTSAGDVTVMPKVLSAAERFRPLSAADQATLVATADNYTRRSWILGLTIRGDKNRLDAMEAEGAPHRGGEHGIRNNIRTAL